jgi:hypothetical protein
MGSFIVIGMPANAITSETLWDAVERIGNEDGSSASIKPTVAAKLIEFKLVKLAAKGLPQLTATGEKAMIVLEYGPLNNAPECWRYFHGSISARRWPTS